MRAVLKFDNKQVGKPIISALSIEKKVFINILRAEVDEKGGSLLIEIPDERAQEILKAIEKEGVKVEQKVLIEINDRCINCGHCITLCPVEAIIQKPDLTVQVKTEQCVQCGRCIDACPLRALVLY